MKPLYLSETVRTGLGPCLRPGGEALTRRILDLVAPPPDSVVFDGGCGNGAAMALLREHGLNLVFGCDIDPGLTRAAGQKGLQVALADLSQLPLPDGSLDLIVCECVWNLTDREKVSREFARVLKPGGRLAISDMYSRSGALGSWPVACCFAGASGLTEVADLLGAAGFTLEILEDHTPLLKQTTANFVFAHGSLHGFWQAALGDADLATAACSAAAASRPGLFLLVARRNPTNERL